MPDDLHAVRDRLDAAHAAAERLVQEAASRVPPRGFEPPREPAEDQTFAPELQAVLGMLSSMRHAMPPELEQQVIEAVRELLLAMRALIDWWIERMDRPPAQSAEVEDIPIDYGSDG